MSCEGCKKPFTAADSQRFTYNEKEYHGGCFTCCECKEPMGSRSFYKMGDGNCCSDCFDKNHSKTCKQCGEKVAGGVKVGDDTYHSGCFTCGDCKRELAGMQFSTVEGKRICSDCYSKAYAKTCVGCGQQLVGNIQFVSVGDKSYHGDCFKCSKCETNLQDKGFVPGAGNDIMCQECASK